jgi:hypothetical protein
MLLNIQFMNSYLIARNSISTNAIKYPTENFKPTKVYNFTICSKIKHMNSDNPTKARWEYSKTYTKQKGSEYTKDSVIIHTYIGTIGT